MSKTVTTVEGIHKVAVHAEPSMASAAVSWVAADSQYTGLCWTFGDTITEYVGDTAFTNNKWVRLRVAHGVDLVDEGYISGLWLKGDETGGVTNSCDG